MLAMTEKKDDFISTADSAKRRKDKKVVEDKLRLGEQGDSETVFIDRSANITFAKGYTRIVYGDHGAYIEHKESVLEQYEHVLDLAVTGEYYDIYKVRGGKVQVYHQKKTVQDKPNPPQGRAIACQDRPEGYADYQPSMLYVSVKSVDVVQNGHRRYWIAPKGGDPHAAKAQAFLMDRNITFLDKLVNNVKICGQNGERKRFVKVDSAVISEALDVPEHAIAKAVMWLTADSKPAVITVISRTARLDKDAVRRYCQEKSLIKDGEELSFANDRSIERELAVRANAAMLPIYPSPQCPVLLDAGLAALETLVFHARCGIIAQTPPKYLVDNGADVQPIIESGLTEAMAKVTLADAN